MKTLRVDPLPLAGSLSTNRYRLAVRNLSVGILTLMMTSLAFATSSLPISISKITSVSGFLVTNTNSSVLEIRIDPFRAPLRIEAQGAVRETLAQLSDGSWIVGRGEISRDQMTLRLDAIQTIGLREVIGAWTSPQNEIFEFRTFNRLYRYQAVQKDGAVHLKLLQKLEYALTPDAGQAYSIFITDPEKRISFGILRVDGSIEANSQAPTRSNTYRTLLLTMYDSQTGSEAQKFSLSPLLVK